MNFWQIIAFICFFIFKNVSNVHISSFKFWTHRKIPRRAIMCAIFKSFTGFTIWIWDTSTFEHLHVRGGRVHAHNAFKMENIVQKLSLLLCLGPVISVMNLANTHLCGDVARQKINNLRHNNKDYFC